MKLNDLLELKNYTVKRLFRGKDWNGKKKYFYILKTQSGDEYRIRKYDMKTFIEKGAKYEEIN